MLVAVAIAGAMVFGPVVDAPDCMKGQPRVEEAIEKVGLDVPDGWSVAATCAYRPTVLGRVDHPAKTLRVWAHKTNDAGIRWVIAHELGHVHDRMKLDRLDRVSWAMTRGREGESWYDCGDGCEPLSEDFADMFAACHFANWTEPPYPTQFECEVLDDLLDAPSSVSAAS